jgi:hypothetical protein
MRAIVDRGFAGLVAALVMILSQIAILGAPPTTNFSAEFDGLSVRSDTSGWPHLDIKTQALTAPRLASSEFLS